MTCQATPAASVQASIAFEVNSVPWSLTIDSGLPRLATSALSSRATRLPEIEVSTTAARHSLVTSSTTLRMRSRRPVTSWSCTKSTDQRAFGVATVRIGAHVPVARSARVVGAPTGPLRDGAAGSSCGSRSSPPSAEARAGDDCRSAAARPPGRAAARGDPHRRDGGCGTGSSSDPRQRGSTPAARSPRAPAPGGRQLSALRRALPLSCQKVLQRDVLEHRGGKQPLQLGVPSTASRPRPPCHRTSTSRRRRWRC